MNPTSYTPTTEATEQQWQMKMTELGLSIEHTPAEMLIVAKKCFYEGNKCGQVLVISSMKEIFYNDPCLFEEYFEENDEHEGS